MPRARLRMRETASMNLCCLRFQGALCSQSGREEAWRSCNGLFAPVSSLASLLPAPPKRGRQPHLTTIRSMALRSPRSRAQARSSAQFSPSSSERRSWAACSRGMTPRLPRTAQAPRVNHGRLSRWRTTPRPSRSPAASTGTATGDRCTAAPDTFARAGRGRCWLAAAPSSLALGTRGRMIIIDNQSDRWLNNGKQIADTFR